MTEHARGRGNTVDVTTNTRVLAFSDGGERLFVADDESLSVLDTRLRVVTDGGPDGSLLRLTSLRNPREQDLRDGKKSSAVAVVAVVMKLLAEDGVHDIEGPTSFVAVGSHPRGAIAVDEDGIAQVIDLD